VRIRDDDADTGRVAEDVELLEFRHPERPSPVCADVVAICGRSIIRSCSAGSGCRKCYAFDVTHTADRSRQILAPQLDQEGAEGLSGSALRSRTMPV
jgi:hypothetical protein